MIPTMRDEYVAGRLTPAEYIAALELEIERWHETYDLARAQAKGLALIASEALKESDRLRADHEFVLSELHGLHHDLIKQVSSIDHRYDHPAGGRRHLNVVEGGEG